MIIDDFLKKLYEYEDEFLSAHGRKPITLEEFKQYLVNRKFRFGKRRSAKSLSWLLHEEGGTDSE